MFTPGINTFQAFNQAAFNFDAYTPISGIKANNAGEINSQAPNNFFTIQDNSNRYIYNTNLNIKKRRNYNINNLNNINGEEVPNKNVKDLSNMSHELINLLDRKKLDKISNKIQSISSSSMSELPKEYKVNYLINVNNLNSKNLKRKLCENNKPSNKTHHDLLNKNNHDPELLFSLDNSSNSKLMHSQTEGNYSLLSLEEESHKWSKKKPNNTKVPQFFNKADLEFEEEQEENEEFKDKIIKLKKACDSLMFFKINLSGAAKPKNLLDNINQIQTLLDQLKNCNTYEVN